jgi:hypothetical protein
LPSCRKKLYIIENPSTKAMIAVHPGFAGVLIFWPLILWAGGVLRQSATEPPVFGRGSLQKTSSASAVTV